MNTFIKMFVIPSLVVACGRSPSSQSEQSKTTSVGDAGVVIAHDLLTPIPSKIIIVNTHKESDVTIGGTAIFFLKSKFSETSRSTLKIDLSSAAIAKGQSLVFLASGTNGMPVGSCVSAYRIRLRDSLGKTALIERADRPGMCHEDYAFDFDFGD